MKMTTTPIQGFSDSISPDKIEVSQKHWGRKFKLQDGKYYSLKDLIKKLESIIKTSGANSFEIYTAVNHLIQLNLIPAKGTNKAWLSFVRRFQNRTHDFSKLFTDKIFFTPQLKTLIQESEIVKEHLQAMQNLSLQRNPTERANNPIDVAKHLFQYLHEPSKNNLEVAFQAIFPKLNPSEKMLEAEANQLVTFFLQFKDTKKNKWIHLIQRFAKEIDQNFPIANTKLWESFLKNFHHHFDADTFKKITNITTEAAKQGCANILSQASRLRIFKKEKNYLDQEVTIPLNFLTPNLQPDLNDTITTGLLNRFNPQNMDTNTLAVDMSVLFHGINNNTLTTENSYDEGYQLGSFLYRWIRDEASPIQQACIVFRESTDIPDNSLTNAQDYFIKVLGWASNTDMPFPKKPSNITTQQLAQVIGRLWAHYHFEGIPQSPKNDWEIIIDTSLKKLMQDLNDDLAPCITKGVMIANTSQKCGNQGLLSSTTFISEPTQRDSSILAQDLYALAHFDLLQYDTSAAKPWNSLCFFNFAIRQESTPRQIAHIMLYEEIKNLKIKNQEFEKNLVDYFNNAILWSDNLSAHKPQPLIIQNETQEKIYTSIIQKINSCPDKNQPWYSYFQKIIPVLSITKRYET
jgi:hypothetical protein